MKKEKVYSFSELSKESQDEAISNYCDQHGCFSEATSVIIEHFESWNYLFRADGTIW